MDQPITNLCWRSSYLSLSIVCPTMTPTTKLSTILLVKSLSRIRTHVSYFRSWKIIISLRVKYLQCLTFFVSNVWLPFLKVSSLVAWKGIQGLLLSNKCLLRQWPIALYLKSMIMIVNKKTCCPLLFEINDSDSGKNDLLPLSKMHNFINFVMNDSDNIKDLLHFFIMHCGNILIGMDDSKNVKDLLPLF